MHTMLTAVLAVRMALPAAGAGGSRPGKPEARLLELVNAERAAQEMVPLKWDPALAELASAHAADMARSGKVSHISSSDGADFLQRLSRIQMRVSAAAENVGVDRNVVEAHRSFMSSPLHRANILDPDLLSVGIAVVTDPDLDVIYVVQDFASPMASLSEEGAVGRVRKAVRRALESSILPPVEDRVLSRSLSEPLARMITADSVEIDKKKIGTPGWIFAYTTSDPSRLPEDVRFRLQLSDRFGFAVVFAKTVSYPLGVYWVLLSLNGSTDDEIMAD